MYSTVRLGSAASKSFSLASDPFELAPVMSIVRQSQKLAEMGFIVICIIYAKPFWPPTVHGLVIKPFLLVRFRLILLCVKIMNLCEAWLRAVAEEVFPTLTKLTRV